MHNYKPIIKLLKNRIKNNQSLIDWHLKYWGYAHWSDTTDYGYQCELFAVQGELELLLNTIQKINNNENKG
tara:strand:+ start:431 stop:643 length:213 start_codon:yes stop_codon:yes gene_type:complete